MVNKSKKLNKSRYFKRRSPKLNNLVKTKRMYGGENKNEYIYPPTSTQNRKLEEVKLPPPTMMENLEDLGNLGASALSNVVATGVNSLSKTFNVDPNKPANETLQELSNRADKMVKVLESPQGKQFLNNFSNLSSKFVKSLEPAANEVVNIGNDLVKKEIPIIGNMANEAVLMIPGPGTVVGAIEEVGNVAQSLEAAAESVGDLTTVSAETAKKIEEEKKDLETVWEQGKNLLGDISTGINKGASDLINVVQDKVDNYGENIMKDRISEIKNIPSTNELTGGALKKYQNEKRRIGARTQLSQLEFLTSNVNRSHILKQYGKKFNTKRRYFLKRRLTSRKI